MSLCHVDHYPYLCDDDSIHHFHHHHHHHGWWHHPFYHSSCLIGQVTISKNGFQLQIDVHHFKFEELTVKTLGEWIIVEGKQSNPDDEPICISKQFTRKYKLPRGYDPKLVTTTLSSDGILLVKAPAPEKQPDVKEKIIEIQKTGAFFKSSLNDDGNGDKKDKNDNSNDGEETEKEKGKDKISQQNDDKMNNVDGDKMST